MLRAVIFTGGTLASPVLFPAGTYLAPSVQIGAASDGLFQASPDYVGVTDGVSTSVVFGGPQNGYSVNVLSGIGFSTDPRTVASDLVLTRHSANALAQRNGLNTQEFQLYKTYTDNSNYERLTFKWGGASFEISQETAGTGTARNLALYAGAGRDLQLGDVTSGARWGVQGSTGGLYANADNTYDIGIAGARPRDLNIGRNATVGGSLTVSAGAVTFGVNNTYDIGSGTFGPRTVYANTSVITPYVRTTATTVAALPAAATAGAGARAFVTDATSAAFAVAAAGGGANAVPVYSTGAGWFIG